MRRLALAAVVALWSSVALLVLVGLLGPSAAEPEIGTAAGWPPYFWRARPADLTVAAATWAAVVLGGAGVAAGLIAVRRGWRPRPRRLIICSVLAVVALTLTPPLGSNDILDYAVYGRIAALGHSPYVMTPAQLRRSGDPVGAVAPVPWQHDPSAYGPVATVTERAASDLAGPSPARTIFWIKLWNALAYLVLVLALDRLLRQDAARRVRAHLLWSVNPLMLLAVMAGGHLDGLAAAFGVLGLLAFRRGDARGGLAAGVLIGVAVAIKAPFALFGGGLVAAARRSPRTLAVLAIGAAAVLVPSYLLAGARALTAVTHAAAGPVDLYEPWQLVYRVIAYHHLSRTTDELALAATVLLAAVLLWRLPDGPPGLVAIRPSLALSLAWLVCSPQQRPWFDAMILPLVAVMPASRLDWLVLFRAAAAAAAELPGITYYNRLRPEWLYLVADIISRGLVPLGLAATSIALLWLCATGRWRQGAGRASPGGRTLPDLSAPGVAG
jgi:hypothetical protein